MALLPNFPISGDDYTVGTITTVAGSKEFKTKDAYLQSYGAVQAGDHIYIAAAAKFLIIGSITGENAGTLTDHRLNYGRKFRNAYRPLPR